MRQGVTMPFRYLSETSQKRLSRSRTVLPILVLLIGVFVTGFLARVFHKTENRSHLEVLSASARALSGNVELILLNNALRVQTFVSLVDLDKGHSTNNDLQFKQLLANTMFQRISRFNIVKKQMDDGLP